MKIHIGSRTSGDERTMTVTLQGNDMDFIGLIDEGANLGGDLGILVMKMATTTGLVAERADDRAEAARLLQRAIAVLQRGAD